MSGETFQRGTRTLVSGANERAVRFLQFTRAVHLVAAPSRGVLRPILNGIAVLSKLDGAEDVRPTAVCLPEWK